MDSDKVIKDLGNWVDEKVKLNDIIGGVSGQVAEGIDGFIFTKILEAGYEKTPDDKKGDILKLYAAISVGDIELIKSIVSNELVLIIKTGLGDKREGVIIFGILDIVTKLALIKK